VGRAAPVLAPRARAAAFVALFAALLAFYELREHLPNVSLWWDVGWLALVLLPAVFGLVLIALPLWDWRGTGPAAAIFALATVVLRLLELDVLANFTKLAAVVLAAWWFLSIFEELSWVVLVACVIPWVDAYSVFRGPTKHIVTNRPGLFHDLSLSLPVPGEQSTAHLGLPDVLFFGLFLAAAVRFRLRTFWSWLAMTLSFGATVALAVWLDLDGLPALPLLSVAFLLPNADLLWTALREARTRRSAG
jgi:hypothetical protein